MVILVYERRRRKGGMRRAGCIVDQAFITPPQGGVHAVTSPIPARRWSDGRDHARWPIVGVRRSEEHTSELQSLTNIVCRLLLAKKNNTYTHTCRSRLSQHDHL